MRAHPFMTSLTLDIVITLGTYFTVCDWVGSQCVVYINFAPQKTQERIWLTWLTRLPQMMPMGHENLLQSFQEIVKDYVGYKLRQRNIFLAGYHVESTSPAARHLRRVADELIEENRQLFETMCDQLHLTPASTYATFVGIADEIFQTGTNWGRIVAFLAFGATLVVYCASREDLAQLIENIVEWISLYMNQNLGPWINNNGGWVSMFGITTDLWMGPRSVVLVCVQCWVVSGKKLMAREMLNH